mgnify:CR=1 FL=1
MNQTTRIIEIKSCGDCPYHYSTVNGFYCKKTGKQLNKTTYIKMNFIPDFCRLKIKTKGDAVYEY